jgi:hypothetical protein
MMRGLEEKSVYAEGSLRIVYRFSARRMLGSPWKRRKEARMSTANGESSLLFRPQPRI